MRTPKLIALIAIAASSTVFAQTPARETPRPQDIDPAVDTSAAPPGDTAAPSSPARATPRADDLEPRVNTSSTEQSPDKPSSTAGAPAAPAGAAKPAAKGGKALDRLELDSTQITGNRELPKVLYIVPWKRSDLGDLVGKPVNSLLDEVLTPVDRDVFRRENRYYRALTPGADQGVGPEYSDGSRPYQRATPGSAKPAAGSVGSATDKPAGTGGNATPPTGNER